MHETNKPKWVFVESTVFRTVETWHFSNVTNSSLVKPSQLASNHATRTSMTDFTNVSMARICKCGAPDHIKPNGTDLVLEFPLVSMGVCMTDESL